MEFLLALPLAVIILGLIIGIALVLLEMFMPGIGITGITGGILIIAGLIALGARIGTSVIWVVLLIGLILIWSLAVLTRTARSGKNPLVLMNTSKKEAGFSANAPEENLLGTQGTALTNLRPAGIALLNERRLDVVTQGEFIKKDTPLTVTAVEGRRIVVKRTEL